MPEVETSMPASPNFDKLKAKLRELFELDKATLAKGGEAVRDQYLLGYFLDAESAGNLPSSYVRHHEL